MLHIKYGEGENIHWHCGTTLHGKELERGAQCRRAPTTDNLEACGKAVVGEWGGPVWRTDQPRLEGWQKPEVKTILWGERKPPILPEYGTLNPPPSDPYAVRIGGVLADPARIARAYEIHDGMLFSALKKILRSGRKHKDRATDIREAITSLERWEAMNREDAQ